MKTYTVETYLMGKYTNLHGEVIHAPIEDIEINDLAIVDLDPDDGGVKVEGIDISVWESDWDDREAEMVEILDISISNCVPQWRELAEEIEELFCNYFERIPQIEREVTDGEW